MTLRSRVVTFAWKFVLVYGLLIFPWPGWNATYNRVFCTVGNALLGHDDQVQLVHFDSSRESHGMAGADARITIANRLLLTGNGHGPVTILDVDSRSLGWTPTALTLALIGASHLPWRRKIPALLGGLALITTFIAVSIGFYIWNRSTAVLLVTLTPFWQRLADGLEYALITQLGISFTMPVLIWMLVVFRRADVANSVAGEAWRA